jgi:hypothetical protein
VTTTNLINSLSGNGEDYNDFVISNGWLYGVKQRNELSSKKTKGDGGKVDESLIPEMREEIQRELEGYALENIFNCDEMALQYGNFN